MFLWHQSQHNISESFLFTSVWFWLYHVTHYSHPNCAFSHLLLMLSVKFQTIVRPNLTFITKKGKMNVFPLILMMSCSTSVQCLAEGEEAPFLSASVLLLHRLLPPSQVILKVFFLSSLRLFEAEQWLTCLVTFKNLNALQSCPSVYRLTLNILFYLLTKEISLACQLFSQK